MRALSLSRCLFSSHQLFLGGSRVTVALAHGDRMVRSFRVHVPHVPMARHQKEDQRDERDEHGNGEPADESRLADGPLAKLSRNVVRLIDHVAECPADFARGKRIGEAQAFEIVVFEADGVGQQKPHVPRVEAQAAFVLLVGGCHRFEDVEQRIRCFTLGNRGRTDESVA